MRPRGEDSATADFPIRPGALRLASFPGSPIPRLRRVLPINGKEFDLRWQTPPRGVGQGGVLAFTSYNDRSR